MVELPLDPPRRREADRPLSLAPPQLRTLGCEQLAAEPVVALGVDGAAVAARLEPADPALVQLPERQDQVVGDPVLPGQLVEPAERGQGDGAARLELRVA